MARCCPSRDGTKYHCPFLRPFASSFPASSSSRGEQAGRSGCSADSETVAGISPRATPRFRRLPKPSQEAD